LFYPPKPQNLATGLFLLFVVGLVMKNKWSLKIQIFKQPEAALLSYIFAYFIKTQNGGYLLSSIK